MKWSFVKLEKSEFWSLNNMASVPGFRGGLATLPAGTQAAVATAVHRWVQRR